MTLHRSGHSSARHRPRLGLAVGFWSLVFLVLAGRFYYLQIVKGEVFRERARISLIDRERIKARRGIIRDRFGVVLAQNVAVHQLTVLPHFLRDEGTRAGVLTRLSELLGRDDAWRQALDAKIVSALQERRAWETIVAARGLVDDTCPESTTRMKVLAKPSPEGHNLQCPIDGRTYFNQVAMVQSALHELRGVELRTRFEREYPFRYDAAHVLGYMNRVNRKELDANPTVYTPQDKVGRRGIERNLEAELRGAHGEALYLKDSKGRRLRTREVESVLEGVQFRRAEAGQNLWLTIDIKLQREVRKAFRYYKSGAAVVIDPRTGEILALYSKPGFDSNAWSGRLSRELWEETHNNPFTPLVNKALTPYAPGSVYKVVTALAALRDKGISPDLTVNCPGYMDYYSRRFRCHLHSGHGPVDLVDAFKYSCDVYYYKLGDMLGMEVLAKYGRLLGFGQHSGIELTERVGIVPTREYYNENTELGWQPGHVLSTAIGQGALTATPLQVARALASVINGGRMLKSTIVKRASDERGNILREAQPELMWDLGLPAEHLAIVREGLIRVINDRSGTAHDIAMDSIVIGGKTGTAEAAESRPGMPPELLTWLKEDHAWFAAYAPADEPQVVVVVFVEHGGSGSKIAAPIAQRIIKSWMRRAPHLNPPEAVEAEGQDKAATPRDAGSAPDTVDAGASDTSVDVGPELAPSPATQEVGP